MAILTRGKVEQLVTKWASQQQTTETKVAIEGPVFASELSCVYRMVWDGAPFPIAVKVFARGHDSLGPFKSLQDMSTLLGEGSDFTVPIALAHVPEGNIVLMEWVDGATIGSLVRRPRCETKQASTYVGRAGTWLGTLHRVHIFDEKPFELEFLTGRINELSLQLPREGIRGKVGSQVLERLSLSAPAVARVPVKRCWSHGDFKPTNILIAGRKTIGLDLDSTPEMSTLEDIGHFLNHLYALVYYTPLSLVRPGRAAALEASFFDGYRTRMTMPPNLPLNWFRVVNVMRMWAQIEPERSSLMRGLYAYDVCGALLELLMVSLQN